MDCFLPCPLESGVVVLGCRGCGAISLEDVPGVSKPGIRKVGILKDGVWNSGGSAEEIDDGCRLFTALGDCVS
jgi:hypothetical protein